MGDEAQPGSERNTADAEGREIPQSDADRLAEARDLIRTLERQLGVAVMLTDVDGEEGEPVTISATAILGRVSTQIVASGHDEPAALLDLARQLVTMSGRDEQWLLRYGLGMG